MIYLILSLVLLGQQPAQQAHEVLQTDLDEVLTDLKQDAFQVLNTKCNVCHRKQNPFKIFSLKNMEKHASKINEQVFIKQRMPKGDRIKLTDEEANILKAWISSQNKN